MTAMAQFKTNRDPQINELSRPSPSLYVMNKDETKSECSRSSLAIGVHSSIAEHIRYSLHRQKLLLSSSNSSNPDVVNYSNSNNVRVGDKLLQPTTPRGVS
jgi:hypothetical protein